MAEPRDENPIDKPRPNETSDTEHDRVRSSNDRDQAAEREGSTTAHNAGYDEAVGGRRNEDVDPDSAESDVERDDSVGD